MTTSSLLDSVSMEATRLRANGVFTPVEGVKVELEFERRDDGTWAWSAIEVDDGDGGDEDVLFGHAKVAGGRGYPSLRSATVAASQWLSDTIQSGLPGGDQ